MGDLGPASDKELEKGKSNKNVSPKKKYQGEDPIWEGEKIIRCVYETI